MASALNIFKKKVCDDDYQYLADAIYQYCTNSEAKPAPLDEIDVVGYCKVYASNHGLVREDYAEIDSDNVEYNIIALYNKAKKWYCYLAFPPYNIDDDISSYLFESGDLCYCYIRDGFDEDDLIISNSSGDELLVKLFEFDEGESIPASKIFPDNFVDFSAFCCKYQGKARKPSLKQMIDMYNNE